MAGHHVHVYFVTGMQAIDCPRDLSKKEALAHAIATVKTAPAFEYPDTQYIAIIPGTADGARY